MHATAAIAISLILRRISQKVTAIEAEASGEGSGNFNEAVQREARLVRQGRER